MPGILSYADASLKSANGNATSMSFFRYSVTIFLNDRHKLFSDDVDFLSEVRSTDVTVGLQKRPDRHDRAVFGMPQ